MPKQQPLKWVLPEVVHPVGTICYQVNVPAERHYIGAFLGAMFLLSKPYAWGDDAAHTAIEVGKVWRDIFDNLRPGGCLPELPPFGHGIEIEDLMPLRVDCDCNVFITCCDGTEKQILTADQVTKLLSNGGAGTPQPQPGGGCQSYPLIVPAGAVGALIPTIVNSGDTIELSSLDGTWYGGSVTWYCPDGSVFFAGCTPLQNFNGSSQIPGSPIGRVIALINGTYYDILGSVFTVPGGIVNQQVTLLMNTDTISTSSGSVSLIAKVCNNQASSFTHTFDLTLSPGIWTVRDQGVYTSGVGYTDGTVVYPPNTFRGCDIQALSITPFTLTRLQLRATDVAGSFGANSVNFGNVAPGVYFTTQAMTGSDNIYDSGPLSIAGVTQLFIDQICGLRNGGDPGGTVLAVQITVSGLGSDPF